MADRALDLVGLAVVSIQRVIAAVLVSALWLGLAVIFVLALWFALAMRVQAAGCSDSKTHRVICEAAPGEYVMSCERWAELVQNNQMLGPGRFTVILRNYIVGRPKAEQFYILLFNADASAFVLANRFANPEVAFAEAMQACGVWSGV